MPKRKTRQNQEVVIPIKPEDVKQSVEVKTKTLTQDELVKVEKQGTKIVKTKKSRAKKAKGEKYGSEETKEEEIRGIKLKNYNLIITEKPQAALKIASALGNGKEKKRSELGVPYYELEREGKKIIVACAVGHLFTLAHVKNDTKGKEWPIFDIVWQPNYKVKKNDWSKKYYTALQKLSKNASDFIVCTDYDTEGEVIGLNIIRFIAKQQDAQRMKFSTLTSNEIQEAYEKKLPTLDWGQAIAGETRHYLDWFYGINLSRGLMEAIKKAGSFRIFSIGRVQGPALNLVVKKELAIREFKATPYWQVSIIIDSQELKYPKDITKKQELEKFQDLKGNVVSVTTKKTREALPPPAPFDLTTLQTEAYKFYSINPARTLQIAQSLYLAGLISYPRTSSQKIPKEINPLNIIKKLSSKYKETSLCTRNFPIEGKKSDPAHPSIYPTGEFANVVGDEAKIYDLIVRRFLACFCEDALIDNKTIEATIGELRFILKGLKIAQKNWLEVYKMKLFEKEVPDMNGEYKIKEVKIEEKLTQPPKRFTPASLVSELARRNLGTKSTRAMIIETLYNRGYIQGQSIEATPLGINLIKILEKYSPIIIDEALTRNFEKEMDSIQKIKKNYEEKEKKIINDAKQVILQIAGKFLEYEKKIGEELVEANAELREGQRKEAELFTCPVCNKRKLRILFNKTSRRYFAACSAYPECKTTFTLPHGLIKKTDKKCEVCGWQKLIAIKKGRRPWEFCFNPACESRKQYENNKTS